LCKWQVQFFFEIYWIVLQLKRAEFLKHQRFLLIQVVKLEWVVESTDKLLRASVSLLFYIRSSSLWRHTARAPLILGNRFSARQKSTLGNEAIPHRNCLSSFPPQMNFFSCGGVVVHFLKWGLGVVSRPSGLFTGCCFRWPLLDSSHFLTNGNRLMRQHTLSVRVWISLLSTYKPDDKFQQNLNERCAIGSHLNADSSQERSTASSKESSLQIAI
jgi:hypothetical protein